MLAAIMSGQGSDHTGGGLAQALSHAIGPRSSAPNGVVEALLLPHAMRFNASVVPGRIAAIGEYLGLTDADPEAVVAEVERLLDVFEAPRRLQDIGVEQGHSARPPSTPWTTGPSPQDRVRPRRRTSAT